MKVLRRALRCALFALPFLLLPLSASAEGEPFRWETAVDGETLSVTLRVAPGFYVDAETLTLLARSRTGGSPLPAVHSPVPTARDDGAGGTVKVLPEGEWVWRFRGTPPFSLSVEFNGCRSGASGIDI